MYSTSRKNKQQGSFNWMQCTEKYVVYGWSSISSHQPLNMVAIWLLMMHTSHERCPILCWSYCTTHLSNLLTTTWNDPKIDRLSEWLCLPMCLVKVWILTGCPHEVTVGKNSLHTSFSVWFHHTLCAVCKVFGSIYLKLCNLMSVLYVYPWQWHAKKSILFLTNILKAVSSKATTTTT